MNRLKIVLVGLAVIGTLVAGGWLLRKSITRARPTPVDPVAEPGGSKLFNNVLYTVRNYAVDSLDESAIYKLATSGVLSELGDPYAALVADLDTADQRDGIGPPPVQGLYLDWGQDFVTVVSVIPGSPAAAAGIRPGDAVLRIDRTVIATQSPDQVARLIDGAAGDSVRLRLAREGVGAPLWITITRGAVPPLPTPVLSSLGGSARSLRVYQIDTAAVRSLRQAIDSGAAAGGGLVLDLRGAVGGTLADAVTFADLLLGSGQTIVTSRGRPATDSTAFIDRAPAVRPELALVVLVDRGTAGAAEVVAGALQDHDRAAIVGETTFGRGVGHTFFPLGNGYSLRLTTAVWVTPSGRVIQRFPPPPLPEGSTDTLPSRPKFRTDGGRTVLGGGGVVPDREIPVEREASRVSDQALAMARAMLSRAATRKALIAALSAN